MEKEAVAQNEKFWHSLFKFGMTWQIQGVEV